MVVVDQVVVVVRLIMVRVVMVRLMMVEEDDKERKGEKGRIGR